MKSSCPQCQRYEAKIAELTSANEQTTRLNQQMKRVYDETMAKSAQKDIELARKEGEMNAKVAQSLKDVERLTAELALARGDTGLLGNVNQSVQVVVSKMASLEAHMMRLADDVRGLRPNDEQPAPASTTTSRLRSPGRRSLLVQMHNNSKPPPPPAQSPSSPEVRTERPRRLSIDSDSSGSSSSSGGTNGERNKHTCEKLSMSGSP